ncbi:lysin B [Gordonia phage KimmyK]|uniref:Lysin B n=1 Tax=Gordonia phage KimmyK TaxID=2250394 RepID=A0A345KSI2_9CAUD|nr:lysin B [Gordonia phage KimmyK]AXH45984.1 lysin B [Gordonia phage KimmyK]
MGDVRRLVTVCGIGEVPGQDLLGQLRRALPEFEHVLVEWSASYGFVNPRRDPFGPAFTRSMADGIARTRAALDGGLAVAAGFSGGAAVLGHVAQAGHPNLVGAGLVSDPFHPDGGIAGHRLIPTTVPVRWETNPRDVICACPDDSPLVEFAKVSAAFSLGDPAGWGLDVLTKLRAGRLHGAFRSWNVFAELARYNRAITGAAGYLGVDPATLRRVPSEHTVYNWKRPYRGRTYLEELAVWLRAQAEREAAR